MNFCKNTKADQASIVSAKELSQLFRRYNIFKDENIILENLTTQIRRVFEEGGTAEFVIDYNFTQIKQATSSHSTHKILRILIFAIQTSNKELGILSSSMSPFPTPYRFVS